MLSLISVVIRPARVVLGWIIIYVRRQTYQYLKLLLVASTAYHMQNIVQVKLLDTATESID